MSYDTTKLVKLAALKALAEKVQSDYALKADLTSLSNRVDDLVTAGGEPNILNGVKVNGTALAIAEKMVDILIATGATNGTLSVNGVDVAIKGLAALAFKEKVSQDDLDTALAAVLAGKADSATTLDGYGITDAYTKAQIDAKISAVYKPAGSVAFADLPTAAESVLGNVYNVTNAFTTTAAFVEGAGNKYPKGTNVVVVLSGEEYKYDVLAGFVDLSGYVEKETGKVLSSNDFTDELKTKLDGIAEGANNYTHPTHDAHASGLYKVTVDDKGHVTAATAVVKADITGLGIPAQDTTYSNATTSDAGLMSPADKTKLEGVATGATKVEASATNGKVKINGTETTVYTEPADVVHGDIATEAEVTEMLNEVFAAA